MTEIDKAAIMSSPIGSLMDSGAVEAPESVTGAPDGAGVVEGTDAVSRAEYDALMAQFDGYRQHMLTVADRYTKRHGWCREVKNAIAEIDPVAKMPTNGATGEITVTMRVEIKESSEEVTPAMVWGAFATLMSEVAYRHGDLSRVNTDQYGTLTGADSLVITKTGGDGLAPYVSPDEWKAQEEKRESERRVSRMQSGYYGTCPCCDSNLNWRQDCKNPECDEHVTDDND